MSSGSVVSLSSFNLLFFTHVLTVLTSTVKYNEYVTDKGKNISIPCDTNGTVVWLKDRVDNTTVLQIGKFLILQNVSETDSGIYICFATVSAFVTAAEKEAARERGEELNKNSTDDSNNNTNNSSTDVTLFNNSMEVDKIKATASINTTTTPTTTTTTTKSTAKGLTTSYPAPTTNTTTTTTTALAATGSETTNTSRLDRLYPLMHALRNSSIKFPQFDEDFVAFQKINLTVRTPPGPVTQLYFKASTILGFLVWRFNKAMSGGYPVRSFTAEFRNVSYREQPFNSTFEHEWSRMDPINIAPNVRQMEVYHLEPNTTYEFRIWANNQLGSGAMVTTNVTTLPETKEEDLIRLIQPDLDNFDPRIWIVAVSIVLGTFVILALGLCIVLSKECYQASHKGYKDGWDSIELIPNIILNPGFCESDGQDTPYSRTIIFGEDDDSDGYRSESESDHEPRMEKFKRKVSIFFTGPTIKRI